MNEPVGKFKDVKLHQILWSVQLGRCKVIKIDRDTNMKCGKIICQSLDKIQSTNSYGFNGKSVDSHQGESLYFENPNEVPTQTLTENKYPKRMLVRDSGKEIFREAIVVAECNGFYLALDGNSTNINIEDIGEKFVSCLYAWNMAEDIPPKTVKKLTLSEMAKLLGVDEVVIIEEE